MIWMMKHVPLIIWNWLMLRDLSIVEGSPTFSNADIHSWGYSWIFHVSVGVCSMSCILYLLRGSFQRVFEQQWHRAASRMHRLRGFVHGLRQFFHIWFHGSHGSCIMFWKYMSIYLIHFKLQYVYIYIYSIDVHILAHIFS